MATFYRRYITVERDLIPRRETRMEARQTDLQSDKMREIKVSRAWSPWHRDRCFWPGDSALSIAVSALHSTPACLTAATC